VSDCPAKLSQILEMGELRRKFAVLATGDGWALAGHHAIERTGHRTATGILNALL
jgi:hypothetical protein